MPRCGATFDDLSAVARWTPPFPRQRSNTESTTPAPRHPPGSLRGMMLPVSCPCSNDEEEVVRAPMLRTLLRKHLAQLPPGLQKPCLGGAF